VRSRRPTQPSGRGFYFAFSEIFPALRNVQERDIAVTAAVATKADHIQVMTIHAAKGLEFPIVAVMTIGMSFPKKRNHEDARLVYVGVTRARDCLTLVHTGERTREQTPTLENFESHTAHLAEHVHHGHIEALTPVPGPPLIAATHLDFYHQCPLKFATFHEGQFLPTWTVAVSLGKRMHKALEHFLSGALQRLDEVHLEECFRNGLEQGDPLRPCLPRKSVQLLHEKFREIVPLISRKYRKTLAVEQRYSGDVLKVVEI